MTDLQALKTFENELNEIVFECFDHLTALELGQLMTHEALKNDLKIVIDISKPNQQLYYYACNYTSPDKGDWVRRKRNVVFQFHTSSIYIAEKLSKDNATLEDKYGLSTKTHVAAGGAVPILVEGVGVIGAITVSGMKPHEDHSFIINTIKAYLK